MQLAVAFYGWLALEFLKSSSIILVACLLAGVGFSLIYFGYHTLIDIEGALLFGVLSIVVYFLVSKYPKERKLSTVGSILTILSLPFIYFNSHLRPSVWMAWGGLVGFSIGCYLIENNPALQSNRKAILKTIVVSVVLIILSFIFKAINIKNESFSQFCQFLLSAFWLGFGANYSVEYFISQRSRKKWESNLIDSDVKD